MIIHYGADLTHTATLERRAPPPERGVTFEIRAGETIVRAHSKGRTGSVYHGPISGAPRDWRARAESALQELEAE